LGLAEVGTPPVPDILEKQPLWTYYSIWSGMVRNTSKRQFAVVMSSPRMLGLNDATYATVTAAYRAACGLPPVHVELPRPSFEGTWILDEEASTLGRMGAGFAPARISVSLRGEVLAVQSTYVKEFADDDTVEDRYPLDGTATMSTFRGRPRTTTVRWSPDRSSIVMDSVTEIPVGPNGTKIKSEETWTLQRQGDRLLIHRISDSFLGPGKMEQTLVFYRG
jgi:hypothetical protein